VLDNNYIRGLCGLSPAELPDSILSDTKIIQKVKLLRAKHFDTIVDLNDEQPTQEAFDQLDYMGYKAISLLREAILYSVPQKIKDNFNEFTRFGTVTGLFDFADAFVAKVENNLTADSEAFTIVSPDKDPVTEKV